MIRTFWNKLVSTFQRKQVRQLPWGVLGILIGIAILSTGWSILQTGDWAGAALNFGTEMAGAVVTYLLLQIVLGTKERKSQLIAQMGSAIRDISIPAIEELKRNNWLTDGSLKRAHLKEANLHDLELDYVILTEANLSYANLERTFITASNFEMAFLQGANLKNANFFRSNLRSADLRGADLVETSLQETNLEGAILSYARMRKADLRGANLTNAKLDSADLRNAILTKTKFNSNTVWPDGFDPVAAGAIFVEETDPGSNSVARG